MMAVKREDLIAQILDLAGIPPLAQLVSLDSTKRSSLSTKTAGFIQSLLFQSSNAYWVHFSIDPTSAPVA